jgi:hypothetical protein
MKIGYKFSFHKEGEYSEKRFNENRLLLCPSGGWRQIQNAASSSVLEEH